MVLRRQMVAQWAGVLSKLQVVVWDADIAAGIVRSELRHLAYQGIKLPLPVFDSL